MVLTPSSAVPLSSTDVSSSSSSSAAVPRPSSSDSGVRKKLVFAQLTDDQIRGMESAVDVESRLRVGGVGGIGGGASKQSGGNNNNGGGSGSDFKLRAKPYQSPKAQSQNPSFVKPFDSAFAHVAIIAKQRSLNMPSMLSSLSKGDNGTNAASATTTATSPYSSSSGVVAVDEILPMCRMPCGAVYIASCVGPLLVGAPSEVLRDLLDSNLPLPLYHLVPADSFSRLLGRHLGVNLAEYEIMALYRRLHRLGPLRLVCMTPSVMSAVRSSLEESLYPSYQRPEIGHEDFVSKYKVERMPDLNAEAAFIEQRISRQLAAEEEEATTTTTSAAAGQAFRPTTLDDLITVQSLRFDDDDGGEEIVIVNDVNGDVLVVGMEHEHGGAFSLQERRRQPPPDDSAAKALFRAGDNDAQDDETLRLSSPRGNGNDYDDVLSSSSSSPRDESSTISGISPSVSVSGVMKLPDVMTHSHRLAKTITPPIFGVTVLGSSCAFDGHSAGPSTGYVVWINRRGILINPPAYASCRLEEEFGIMPSLITAVVLTSCHAGYDAGTFQKILIEGQVVVHSTFTLYNALIRKFSALSGLDQKLLRGSSLFRPVKIGSAMKICGASFDFFYNVDSVASLGFTVSYRGRTILFAGGRTFVKEDGLCMVDKGVMTARRWEDAWAHTNRSFDQVFYDLPLTTNRETNDILRSMGENLSRPFREKLLVNNCRKGSEFPRGDSALKRGPDGTTTHESTIFFEVPTPPYFAATALVESVEHVTFFAGLGIEHAASLVQIAERAVVKKGDVVVHRGKPMTHLNIIVSGSVIVRYDIGSEREFQTGGGTAAGLLTNLHPPHVEGDEHHESQDRGNSESQDYDNEGQDLGDFATPRVIETKWKMGDCFGEEALIGGVSTVNAIAAEDSELIRVANSDLQWILNGTPVRARVQRSHNMRLETTPMETVLMYNSLLLNLTRAQKLVMEMYATIERAARGDLIWQRGLNTEFAIILVKGKLIFPNAIAKLMSGLKRTSGSMMIRQEDLRHTYCPDVFETGSWIGNVAGLLAPQDACKNTLQAVTDCVYFKLSKKNITIIMENNPGLLLALGSSEFVI